MLSDIHWLEGIHKSTNDAKTFQLISSKCLERLHLLNLSHVKQRELTLHAIHEFGKKCGRQLTHYFSETAQLICISKIHCPIDCMVHTFEHIAASFHKCYSGFYNLHPVPPSSSRSDGSQSILLYLDSIKLPSLCLVVIQIIEITMVVKSFPAGKSPGRVHSPVLYLLYRSTDSYIKRHI